MVRVKDFLPRVVAMLLLTLLMTAAAWADDYVWDATTKTLTVNTNPPKGLNYDIEHLVIGSSVTSIGDESFFCYKDLSTVTFAEGSKLESIGSKAFLDCPSLTSITIPASVKTFGRLSFAQCTSLTTFIVDEGSQLESPGESMFSGCNALKTIALLGETVPENGYYVFQGLDKHPKVYVRSQAYKTDTYWSLYYNFNKVKVIYKLTADTGVEVITTPDFTHKGTDYYIEGTEITLGPGSYTVTNADGADVTADVLDGTTLTMPSYDISVAGVSQMQEDRTISSAEEWDEFATAVNNGASYINRTVTLAADISVTTMAGTYEHPFSGTFDGGGKTLIVNINSSDAGSAPFCYIRGATIKDLTVTGSVTSSGNHAGGLVGRSAGRNTISGCTVGTDISGAAYAGGIVGHGGSKSLTMQGCVYSGTITGATDHAGGLMGWCDNLTLTVTGCLMKGAFSGSGKYHPVGCKDGEATVTATVTDTYYLYTISTTETGSNLITDGDGTAVSAVLADGVWDEPYLAADGGTYYAAHVTGKTLPYSYDFETALDTEGWKMENCHLQTGLFDVRSYFPNGGTYSFYFWEDNTDQYLISPKLEGSTDIKVTFDFMSVLDYTQVGYSTTNSLPGSFTWGERLPDNIVDWTPYVTIVPAGTKYVAVKANIIRETFLDNFSFTVLEPATVTFAKEGFCTYYDRYADMVLPAGVKAYIITAQGSGQTLAYQEIADGSTTNKVVPKGTAVMLRTAASDAVQEIDIPLASPTAAAVSGTNLLHGSDTETTTTGGGYGAKYYKLSYGTDQTGNGGSDQSGVLGWFWGEADGAAFTSAAHKCWLALPGSSGARGFIGLPDDGTTAIITPPLAPPLTGAGSSIADGDGAWYMLDGRTLNGKPSRKGVYIHNGKLEVIR